MISRAAASALSDRKRPALAIGGRFTQALARYLVRHLEIVRGGMEEVGSISATWPDRLIDVDRRSVVIAYDIRRYQPDVVRFVEIAAQQGATVILFTDSRAAPACRHASHVFVAPTESAGAWDSLVRAVRADRGADRPRHRARRRRHDGAARAAGKHPRPPARQPTATSSTAPRTSCAKRSADPGSSANSRRSRTDSSGFAATALGSGSPSARCAPYRRPEPASLRGACDGPNGLRTSAAFGTTR